MKIRITKLDDGFALLNAIPESGDEFTIEDVEQVIGGGFYFPYLVHPVWEADPDTKERTGKMLKTGAEHAEQTLAMRIKDAIGKLTTLDDDNTVELDAKTAQRVTR